MSSSDVFMIMTTRKDADEELANKTFVRSARCLHQGTASAWIQTF